MSLIREKGYEALTVQDILDRADVGRSTFYTHFQDKGDLLHRGLENLDRHVRFAQAAAEAPAGKPYEKIIGFSLAMFEHASQFRDIHRALLGSGAETVAPTPSLRLDGGRELRNREPTSTAKAGQVSRVSGTADTLPRFHLHLDIELVDYFEKRAYLEANRRRIPATRFALFGLDFRSCSVTSVTRWSAQFHR